MKKGYSVSVREWVAFVWRRGDLVESQGFVSPSRSLQGIQAHRRLQSSRPPGYQAEVPLAWAVSTPELTLTIKGRLDGLWRQGQTVVIEEIKTYRGGLGGIPERLHWLQAKSYAFIYAAQEGLASIGVQLTYVSLESGKTTVFRENCRIEALKEIFDEGVRVYLEWVRDLHCWRLCRDASIRRLRFPFIVRRQGQKEMMNAVCRALSQGGRMLMEAPTGIGKTMGVLYPALKMLGRGRLDAIYYLTAKTVGRLAAQSACRELRQTGLQARVLTLTARDKICRQDDRPCDRQTCLRGIGYYDRVKPALREALRSETLDRPAIEAVANRHQVCPHALSRDLIPWVDVIVADYNYVFDPVVGRRGLFESGGAGAALLIDEAHNLPERAREMFSATISREEVYRARLALGTSLPSCRQCLREIESWFSAVGQGKRVGAAGAPREGSPTGAGAQLELFSTQKRSRTIFFAPDFGEETAASEGGAGQLEMLLRSIRGFLDRAEAWLSRNEPAPFRQGLMDFYFRAYGFLRIGEMFDHRFALVPGVDSKAPAVRLFCLDPAAMLRARTDEARATVYFSGTLTPMEYYRDNFGGDDQDTALRLQSPFAETNLEVILHTGISTTYRSRAATAPKVAGALSAFVRARKGNYLIYFPSYPYLQSVLEHFEPMVPEAEIQVQSPAMAEGEREAFIQWFHKIQDRIRVAFAVMGGVFGEGIDLVGNRLLGVAVVGVGLPQLSVERDLIRDHYPPEKGYDYAYRYPGWNRVLQAAGRVIRSESDRGIVLLIDQRFGEARYSRLFPAWWRPRRPRTESELEKTLSLFWGNPGVEAPGSSAGKISETSHH